MSISIEVPVFKGRFLRQCVDSVLAQTSDAWTLSLVWDGGDEASRRLLEQLEEQRHPRIRVYFTENRGIARARSFLSAHSEEPYILPLDDDDELSPRAVERFLRAAEDCPWASLLRARRDFIDEEGAVVDEEQWFPFGPRHYHRGMVTDLFNQAQPYLIRRSAYVRTSGWRGFADFMGAGEDCDIFLQLEEVAHFELVDEVLYHYRLHDRRASHSLTPPAAFEMWRRLADEAITRTGLPLERVSEAPPFIYERRPRPALTLADVDFVIRAGASDVMAALRQCGVTPDAIVQVPATALAGTWKMEGYRATHRRVVCYVDGDLLIQARSALKTLVRALDEADVDLVATRPTGAGDHLLVEPETLAQGGVRPAAWLCGGYLLLRREVIAATGGFDDRHVPVSLQNVDLCLQARRRGFRCAEISLEAVAPRGSGAAAWTAADVSELRSKWRSHSALFTSSS